MPRIPLRPLLLVLVAAALVSGVPGRAASVGGPVDPSEQEQLGLYELNLARSDPAAYGARIGVNLSGIAARPPLAVNRRLTASARFHCQEMADHDYFSHTSAVTGDGPNRMAVQHGYDLFGYGLDHGWTSQNYIESLAYGWNTMAGYADALAMLIEDAGVASLGHRKHLLAMDSWFEDHVEVGFGRATAGTKRYYAIHTGYRDGSDRFLTGVVYDDANDNDRYDLGEGLGGVTIRAGGRETTTWGSGGYTLRVDDGSRVVTCSGGSFSGSAEATVAIDGENVEVDFRSGHRRGDVAFVTSEDSIEDSDPVGDDVPEILASATQGVAPLVVAFSPSFDAPGATLAWSFGDGSSTSQEEPDHLFSNPGVYPVVLRTSSDHVSGSDYTVIVVAGSDGAGPGTTPPLSDEIVLTKVTAKVRFDRVARDVMKLKGRIEMPAGLRPGSHRFEVCIGPVRFPFVLDEEGKADLPDGTKARLRYAWPKGGGPLGSGVVIKFKAKLKGDMTAKLAVAGLLDEDAEGLIEDFPIAILLNGLPYRSTCDLVLVGIAGDQSAAKLSE